MYRRALTLGAVIVGIYLLRRSRNRTGPRPRSQHPGPMTPATNTRNPADAPIGPAGHNLDNRLDEAIEESFPASDPVSVHIE